MNSKPVNLNGPVSLNRARPLRATLSSSVWAVLATGLFAASALAHHSTAMFEWGKEKQLEGTIDKFEWTQPHAFLWVKVPGKGGKEQEWGLEGMSPSWLGRNKWNRNSVKPGEKVKIDYYPLRDGRNGGFFVRVIMPDGTKLEALPGRPRP